MAVLFRLLDQPGRAQQFDLNLDGENLGVHQDPVTVEDHGDRTLHVRR